MQVVAREMNLSETVFVVSAKRTGTSTCAGSRPPSRLSCAAMPRWLPPISSEAQLDSTLEVGSSAARAPMTVGSRWTFLQTFAVQADMPPTLDLPDVVWYGLAHWDSIAVLSDAALVREHVPDLNGIASAGTRGVIVTAPGDRPGIDCVSRVFAPNAGLSEDPVTGTAHCTLAEYWGQRLGLSELVGEQASSRGGIVRMRRQRGRVVIAGQALTVATTRILVA